MPLPDSSIVAAATDANAAGWVAVVLAGLATLGTGIGRSLRRPAPGEDVEMAMARILEQLERLDARQGEHADALARIADHQTRSVEILERLESRALDRDRARELRDIRREAAAEAIEEVRARVGSDEWDRLTGATRSSSDIDDDSDPPGRG